MPEGHTASVCARKIWGRYANKTAFNNNIVDKDAYLPLGTNSSSISTNLNYHWQQISVGIFSTYNKNSDRDAIYSVGSTLRTPILQHPTFNINLELTASRSQNDQQYLATFDFNFIPE